MELRELILIELARPPAEHCRGDGRSFSNLVNALIDQTELTIRELKLKIRAELRALRGEGLISPVASQNIAHGHHWQLAERSRSDA